MDKILSLCKRRGFIFPGSEIYGGLANSWDYGPLGVELKNNIKQEWWKWFVTRHIDVVGIDAALIMNPKVWEASGHLKEFSDPLVECKNCHERFRADQVDLKGACPGCAKKGTFTSPANFNLMLKTFLGPVEDKANIAYFRPELAQAMFVNFKGVLETTRKRLPFGIASQGKAFRNEITPGNFIFRTREFDLMEFEYFIREQEWKKWFEYWLGEMKKWLLHLGVKQERVHEIDIPDGERAHYSKRTIDIEYDYPFGRKELYGLAYRTDFDLKNHMEKSGIDMQYVDPETQEKFLPHVIEPTFGLDRTVLVAMLEAYHEEQVPTAAVRGELRLDGRVASGTRRASPFTGREEGETDQRIVMKFPYWMAPIKVAVLSLSKKEELSNIGKQIYEELAQHFACDYDETQSIGKRYRRQDEVGTPFCVTVDFDTLNDKAVTVRNRDTMEQTRVQIDELASVITDKLNNELNR